MEINKEKKERSLSKDKRPASAPGKSHLASRKSLGKKRKSSHSVLDTGKQGLIDKKLNELLGDEALMEEDFIRNTKLPKLTTTSFAAKTRLK